MQEDALKIRIKFDGPDLPRGTIDIYDFANTILAFGQTAERIARNEHLIDGDNRLRIDVNALRPGSFETELLMCVEPAVRQPDLAFSIMAGVAQTVASSPEKIIDIIDGLLKIKKWLKGDKPRDAKIVQAAEGPTATVYNFAGDNMTVNMGVYTNLQDKEVIEGLRKIVAPMEREGSKVESIAIQANTAKGRVEETVSKFEAPFIIDQEEFQTISDFVLKGVVSAFDRKTGKGRISISEKKRVIFEIAGIYPSHYDKAITDLIESMKLKIPVRVSGEASFDFDGTVKKIMIKRVEPEAKLEL